MPVLQHQTGLSAHGSAVTHVLVTHAAVEGLKPKKESLSRLQCPPRLRHAPTLIGPSAIPYCSATRLASTSHNVLWATVVADVPYC